MKDAKQEPEDGSKRRSWVPWVASCCVILVVVLAIAIANLIEARKQGAEAPAIGALKTITTSQAIFREGDKEGDGTLDYGTLDELSNAVLIDVILGSGHKQGYVYAVRPSPTSPGLMWMAVANPEEPGETGDRYFVTNHAGVIYYTGSNGNAFELNDACEIPPNALPVGR
jgi:hypothetical protein